jgi:calcineurin-like phosphoesterase family protein
MQINCPIDGPTDPTDPTAMLAVMATWFTSDLHLGHVNIIGYCRRPFPDVSAMNEALIDRWNSVVQATDTVWVLGDVALGSIHDSLAEISRLHGRKLLLTGNHDRCWTAHGHKAHAWNARYVDAGFDEIHQGTVLVEIAGSTVLANHFPYHGDSLDADRYLDHRPHDRGDWLLHGHVHERWRQRERMINVGVDVWNGTPVSGDQLAELIASGPADRPPLPFT